MLLRRELDHHGASYEGDGPFRLPIAGAEAHAVLRAIATPLTTLRTHTPTLEDAYLEIIGRTEPEEREG